MVVVRDSPRIHVHANGRGRGREGVAERRTTTSTSARSYAPVLILALALARAAALRLRVTREGIVVGRGRVSAWALLSLSSSLSSSLVEVVGLALRLIGAVIAIVIVRERRLEACYSSIINFLGK
jgi:hypothetical protein